MRWYAFHNYEPLGSVRVRAAMGWRGTDNNATLFASTVSANAIRRASSGLGGRWSEVHLNGEAVFDHPEYPERGHGQLFQDKYNFEEHVPILIPQGDNLLVVTSINAKGSWGVNLRIADEKGFSAGRCVFLSALFRSLTFRLSRPVASSKKGSSRESVGKSGLK